MLEPLRVERGEYGCAVVRLVIGDRCPGVIGFTFTGPRVILMLTAALLKRPDTTPEQRWIVQRIAGSADRMTGLIRDLVDFGRVQQGLGIAVSPEEVDVGDVVRSALSEFEALDHGMRLSLEVGGQITVTADPSRLAQVVSNLVGNALRHGKGAPVGVVVRGEPGGVTLAVHNSGPTIPPEILPHLFEPFFKGDSADLRGEGLGLYIVEQIAQAHGGRVYARSDEASGTSFTVFIPRT